MTLRDERGGIVGGWLFKVVVLLAVVGLCIFESGSIILAKVTVDRTAIEAAQEAGLEYGRTGSTGNEGDEAGTGAATDTCAGAGSTSRPAT